MAEAFDAYHVWLGIPPKDQPPNHYRLLGLELYEAESSVIDNAADRQMGHVRRHQSGKHGEQSQRILNEIAAARVCLLNADRKSEYDSELRRRLAPPPPQRVPMGVAVAAPPPTPETPASNVPTAAPVRATPPPLKPANASTNGHAALPPSPRPPKPDSHAAEAEKEKDGGEKPFPWKLAAIFGGVALAGIAGSLALLIVGLMMVFGGDAEDPTESTDVQLASVASVEDDGETEVYDPETDPNAGSVREVLEEPPAEPVSVTPDPVPTTPEPTPVPAEPEPAPEPPPMPAPVELPTPLARWTFDEDFRDELGELHGTPQGSPKIRSGRLWLDGSSFLVTPPLAKTLTEKTFDVWVSPATLDLRDGGVMCVSQGEGRGATVDGLVYAERDERHWQVATGRRRAPRLNGSAETTPPGELVHLALVYTVDGTVSLYRNGEPYGEPVATRDPAVFEAGLSQIAFGRHSPPAGGLFVGVIDQAQLFDHALDAKQIALLASNPPAAPVLAEKELLAVPDAEQLAAANENVRLVYKEEFDAAKTPALKLMLARRLAEVAKNTTSDSAGRYALLIAARDLFAQGGDAVAALAAVDRIAASFDVHSFELKREVVPVAARAASGAGSAQLAKSAEELADEAIQRDDFETARTLLTVAYTSARNGKAFALARSLAERQKQLGDLAAKFAELEGSLAKVAENPDDADANLAVGLYRACVSGDWVAGLRHLAAGSDERLRTLAEQEGSAPADPLEQIKLGDGWWDASESLDSVYRAALRQRAAHWYRRAVKRLDGGLEKLVAERRLLELETAENDGWRLVFRGTSPALWNTSVDNEEAYAVPVDETADTIKFLRIQRTDSGQFVIVPMNKKLLAEGGAISPALLWRNGSETGGIPFLGVASIALPVTTAGQPYLGFADKSGYSGWGFGGLWQDAAGRSLIWAGQAQNGIELEFSVKSEALSPEELKALLR